MRRLHVTAASSVRVRYAPSPTGALHLGGLRTALFNYLFARRHGGAFLLRIEDTDRARAVPGSVEAILGALRWCGLTPDEGPDALGGGAGPYVQSERLPLYAAAAAQLLASGAAYRCFCGPQRLAALREAQAAAGLPSAYDRACAEADPATAARRAAAGEPNVVRLSAPRGGGGSSAPLFDLVLGEVAFPAGAVEDAVLLKSDGWPTYHLASVVDDHAMRVSHVIRGQEWLPSLPKHAALYAALGWTPPAFAHLPLLLNGDRSKLSKRKGDASVEDFVGKGFLPGALLNFVAQLGWTPPGGGSSREGLASLAELAADFDLRDVHRSNAVVDGARLTWVNNRHVRAAVASASGGGGGSDGSGGGGGGGVSLELDDEGAPLLAALRAATAPFLDVALARVGAAGAALAAPTAGAVPARRLNALLAAQHERVGPLRDFPPLVVPFLLRAAGEGHGAAFLNSYLHSAAPVEALGRIAAAAARKAAAAPAVGGGESEAGGAQQQWSQRFGAVFAPLAPPLAALLTQWAGVSEVAFSQGPSAMDAVRRAAELSGTPVGRLLLPLRWALTGLDAGAALGDTLRLLGKEEALARVAAVVARVEK
jgi:glutamyl-tRNA synthetase